MLAQYKKKAKIGIIIGISLFIVGLGILSPESGDIIATFGALLVLGGYTLLVWGCWFWAKGKGYHGAWGFLGLMHFVGLIILALFPDKTEPVALKAEGSGMKKERVAESVESIKKGRTIEEVRVVGKTPDEFSKFLNNWFLKKGFKVRATNSDGNPIKFGFTTTVKLRPHIGSTVYASKKASGCVVFEISLRKDGNDSIFHGEFYAAGSGLFFRGKEFELSPKPGFMGRWPRKRGYNIMLELMEAIKSIKR